MGGSQSCSGSFGEEKRIFPYQKSNYDSSVTQSVAPVTIQNRLITVPVYYNSWGLKLIPGAVTGRPGYKLRYFDAIFYQKTQNHKEKHPTSLHKSGLNCQTHRLRRSAIQPCALRHSLYVVRRQIQSPLFIRDCSVLTETLRTRCLY
jgi:hypothetical protein